MFKNYLKTAWRNIANNPFYSVLNVGGLALGLATGIMLLLWTQNEKSYDSFHPQVENIYRLNSQFNSNDKTITWEGVPGPIAVNAAALPEVASVVRITDEWDQVLANPEKTKILDGFATAFVDTGFFSIFHFKLAHGSPPSALPDSRSMMISQTTAKKFFETDEVVGRMLRFRGENFVISAVMEDFPDNSSLKYDAIFPMAFYAERFTQNGGNGEWKTIDEDLGNFSFYTFLKIRPQANIEAVSKALTASYTKLRNGDSDVTFRSQPLADIHLIAPDGNSSALRMVQIFFLVAILLLLIAGINYVNLSTARAFIRSREVGIRKIVGANRKQLFFQFLIETCILFALSAIAALLLMYVLMPLYNQISGKSLEFSPANPQVWKVLIFAIAGTLLAASIYPALLLSSFHPLKALKGKISLGAGTTHLRKGLVVFQFAISVMLIVSTLTIGSQMKYVMEKNPGYDRSYVLSVPMPNEALKHADAIKNELRAQGGIEHVSFSNVYNMSSIGSSTGDIDWPGKPESFSMIIAQSNIDKDFIPTMRMQFVEGSNFSGVPADSANYILNETAVRLMGFEPPYVGKEISFHEKKGTVIGVLKDFNFQSMKQGIDPLIFSYTGYKNMLYVRAAPRQADGAIAATENIYQRYANGVPFSYTFLDKQFENLYVADLRAGVLFRVFAGIAIFISCLGLFGLATYTAQVRTKEIGVRKVLGASVSSIVGLLSSDFLKLVCISILVAVPVSWYAMNQWLSDYAYRIQLGWRLFAGAAAVAILIAVVTISYQAIRAAVADPVKSLRSE